ncbi:hypothetical protein L209DRAFT_486636 [Thermothelomyces heterothallicus CBS 203.75]
MVSRQSRVFRCGHGRTHAHTHMHTHTHTHTHTHIQQRIPHLFSLSSSSPSAVVCNVYTCPAASNFAPSCFLPCLLGSCRRRSSLFRSAYAKYGTIPVMRAPCAR